MRHRFLWIFCSLVMSVGCTGSIDGPSGQGAAPQPRGASSTSPGIPSTMTMTGSPGAAPTPAGPREPGRVTMRRLNRTEYDNTVHDLLGTDSRPARAFVDDAQANGFDNNGDLLSLSPVRIDQYEQAAEALAVEALTPPLRARNLSCDPQAGDACVKTFVSTLGTRAYRRPITDDETSRFLRLAGKVRAAGGSPDEVVGAVLQAILLSPNFLFRAEIDPDPSSTKPHPVGPYEIASRLSYLAIASMPDAPLFEAAKSGALSNVGEIQTQLTRLLSDGKGRFAQNFAEQWLGVRTVETLQPDSMLFPAFNVALGNSMKREVDLFFDEFVQNNLPVEQLLTAKFTYADALLSKLYGIGGAAGTSLSRVDLSAHPRRGGLLGMGAMLIATSRGNRTSPVSRGRWVLDALLCSDPPPAPESVKVPSDEVIVATTARAFLEKHRESPVCNACHSTMDPIGLALENYDPIGAWRDTDAGQSIDTRGQLPSGVQVTGLQDLSAALVVDERVRPCLSAGLLAYSLGRSLRDSDRPYVDEIAKMKGGGKVGFRDLLMNVVASEPFRLRQGEPVAQSTGVKP